MMIEKMTFLAESQ